MRLQPVQGTEVSRTAMKSLIKRVALPIAAMGAILAGKADNSNLDGKAKQGLQETVMISVPMEYSRTHMKAVLPKDVIYERYEITGYDGTGYCTQLVKSDNILIDGIDTATCDEIIEMIISKNGGIYNCEKKEMKCIAATEVYGIFKYQNNIESIKRAWYDMRWNCKERTCYKTLGIPVPNEQYENP